MMTDGEAGRDAIQGGADSCHTMRKCELPMHHQRHLSLKTTGIETLRSRCLARSQNGHVILHFELPRPTAAAVDRRRPAARCPQRSPRRQRRVCWQRGARVSYHDRARPLLRTHASESVWPKISSARRAEALTCDCVFHRRGVGRALWGSRVRRIRGGRVRERPFVLGRLRSVDSVHESSRAGDARRMVPAFLARLVPLRRRRARLASHPSAAPPIPHAHGGVESQFGDRAR